MLNYHSMKTQWGVEVWLHAFLTSILDDGEWPASRSGLFILEDILPDTHWIGGWVGLRVGTDAVAKRKNSLPSDGNRTVERPARSLVLSEINLLLILSRKQF